jgi:acetyl-CoA carboxylase carboxyl transferase subunit beta
VIYQTIRETLPDDYQTADFLLERGMVDRVVTRREAPAVLGAVLRTRMMGRERLPAA